MYCEATEPTILIALGRIWRLIVILNNDYDDGDDDEMNNLSDSQVFSDQFCL